jgi:predicted MPP superfamily phosphohydrolase
VRRNRERGRLTRAITHPPYHDESGRKALLGKLARAQPHATRNIRLEVAQWPQWSRPLRVAFLSDFHTGSHTNDVERLRAIIDDVQAYAPDLAVFGGDYINLQPMGGGRVPPHTIAATLGQLRTPLGLYAILGNHDFIYGERLVADALTDHGLIVLHNNGRGMQFENKSFHIAGIPDAQVDMPAARSLLIGLPREPTIVVAHDPVWFGSLPAGPYLMLAGHTHGGQIRLPGLGVIRNGSKAPLRWSYGLVSENDQLLYVTSGIGTSWFPIRWHVPPEVVILDLIGKSS